MVDEKLIKDKYAKSTELAFTEFEDDSSDRTQVRILKLSSSIEAKRSIPEGDGTFARVKSNEVYVAAEDIDALWKDTNEVDGVLVYKGPMHLDVSKFDGRFVNGEFKITRPAKIWLKSVKFARGGVGLQQDRQKQLGDVIKGLFANNAVVDLTAPLPQTITVPVVNDTTGNAGGENKPKVVANKAKEEKAGG